LSFAIVLPLLLFVSCVTNTGQNTIATEITKNPETVAVSGTKTTKPADNQTGTTQATTTNTNELDTIVIKFDTVAITKLTFENTKTEMQLVVEELNKITLEKDYTKWLTWLSEEYKQTYSDLAMLDKVSASLPIKGVKLKTLRDYFEYVFVPSRQNMRVDDIQFVSPTRVYVIMEITPKSPAAIYILEKTPSGWKLVLKN
jgi:hypothetical protein